jgi:hypothetical protein
MCKIDGLGFGGLSQSLALVTGLPVWLSGRTFAHAPPPRRLLQPSARRRLAAVRTVQFEVALESSNPRF